MKKLFTLAFLVASVYGNAATLDISGWEQKNSGGNKKPVVITGVAVGEVPFFTNTPGTVDSRKIISTDLDDSTATGRSLLTAATASAAKDVLAVGTTKAGTQAAPITTNPYSPTWSQEQLILYYGATGQINLPAAASYTNRSIVIYITGTFNVTVDANGSEYIVENGASLGAGVADVITGTAGKAVALVSDGLGWIKYENDNSSGITTLTPWTENIDGGGFNLNGVSQITATQFNGSGAGITSVPAGNLVGTIPDITVENLTTSRNNIITPVAGVGNTIVTDNGQTDITLDATTETLTYSATPTTGAWFKYRLIAHTLDSTVTIPSTYSYNTQGNRTTFVVRANKNVYISAHYTGSGYEMWGDPIEIGDLSHDSTPATTAKMEIDQGSGGEYSTIAEILNGADIGAGTAVTASAGDNDTSVATTGFVQTEIDATRTGTHASPYTTASATSPTWSGPIHEVWMGVTQTVNLPAASGYTGRGIIIYNTGAFTITIDSNGSEVIVRDGTAQTGGVNFTLSSGAGNYVCLICDGARWITLGYKGTLTVGS